jgi:DNA-binding GntR family transcriptional regulator
MPGHAAVSRSVLSEQIKDRLLEAILDGRYQPGARIVETRVAREFGTSQAPVREALRDLAALGLVEASAFRGARVRLPSVAELSEAFVVRAHLESLGVSLALPRLTEANIDKLADCLADMRLAARVGDPYAEAKADAAFHGQLMAIAGNAVLERQWQLIEPFSRTYITMVTPGADRQRIADLHQPILDALRSRDGAAATDALHLHYLNAEATLGRPRAAPPPTPANAGPPPLPVR